MTSKQGPTYPSRGAARSAQPPRPCMNWPKSFRKTPHRCCGTPACAGRRCKRSTPRTQSSGMSCQGASSRQPRYWAWNAAGLVGNDPRHGRPCRRPKGSPRPPWLPPSARLAGQMPRSSFSVASRILSSATTDRTGQRRRSIAISCSPRHRTRPRPAQGSHIPRSGYANCGRAR